MQISTGFASWQHYCTASSSGRQPNFAALNRGRHLCSAGRPSRWALAHILVVINAVRLKQVNVGLTTVAKLSPRVRLFHGRYTARTRPCTCPSAWSCTRSCTLLCTGRKHGRASRAVYTAVYVTGRLHGPVHGTAVYTTVYWPGRVH